MLGTHLPWMQGPAFPLPVETRYCLVSDQRYCDFVLLPDRSFTYRADIASRLGLQLRDLLLTPAANRVQDAAFAGRSCRTVIAVGHKESAREPSAAIVCLLDCRPLLQGWYRCTALDGWLDLALLRDSLSHSVPEGWALEFAGCQTHWHWRWVEPGDMVRVTLVPMTSNDPSRSDAAGHPQACHHASVASDADPNAPKPHQPAPSSAGIVPFAALFPHGRTLCRNSPCEDDASSCTLRVQHGPGVWLSLACILTCLIFGFQAYLGRSDFLLSCAMGIGCLGFECPRGHVSPNARRILLGALALSFCCMLPCCEATSTHCSSIDAQPSRLSSMLPPRSGGGFVGWPRRVATPCRARALPLHPLHASAPPPPTPLVSASQVAMDDDLVDISQPGHSLGACCSRPLLSSLLSRSYSGGDTF